MEMISLDPVIKKNKWICPTCKQDTQADRIQRSPLVKLLLGWLLLTRYQCYKCKRKYYSFKR